MAEQIEENLYRIGVALPNNPLRELNSYLIRGEERDLLIDTGFRRPECREALAAGLRELGCEKERTDVLLTHLHSDHAGLAREFAGENRRIYISGRDMEELTEHILGIPYGERFRRYMEEGFPREMMEYVRDTNPASRFALDQVDERFTALGEGDRIRCGGYEFCVLLVPGHTPGNVMLWEEKRGIMVTGDHVLFDISPNITCWNSVKDSLGDYLESLERVKEYPVRLALPGHRGGGDYRERVEALLLHHENRLAETERVVREVPGLTAYELAGRMKWRIRARNWEEFPPVQKRYAVGETIAHLDYLRLRGRVHREKTDGLWRYVKA